MAYVIADPCVATCDTACVDVCPCDCIAGPIAVDDIRAVEVEARGARFPSLQLFIDPEICINCGACEPVCPVSAIFDEDDLPAAWSEARGRNAAFFGRKS